MDNRLSKDVDAPTITELENQHIKQELVGFDLSGPSLHDPVVDTFPEWGFRG